MSSHRKNIYSTIRTENQQWSTPDLNYIGWYTVEKQKNAKIFGVFINENLKWNNHVQNISKSFHVMLVYFVSIHFIHYMT